MRERNGLSPTKNKGATKDFFRACEKASSGPHRFAYSPTRHRVNALILQEYFNKITTTWNLPACKRVPITASAPISIVRIQHLLSPKFTLGLALSVLAAPAPFAATATTEPVGYNTVSMLANSDTYLSVPFQRPAAFVGQVSSVSGNTLTLAGSPGWSTNQFVYAAGSQSNTYYAFIRSGSKEGNYYTITASGSNTLTVDLGGDTFAGLAAGDSVSVIPYWTLGTVFPPANVGVAFASSASALVRATEILLPDLVGSGINLAPPTSYFYLSGAWRRAGQSLALNKNDDILIPDSYLIVRNKAFSGVMVQSGNVVVKKFVTPLLTRVGGKQDNAVAVVRPVPTSLNESGLISSGAFSPSTSPLVRSDELLVVDNTVPGINKAASASYYYYNGAWRKAGANATQDFGAAIVFSPSTAVQIRKAASATGASSIWVNPVTY